MPMRTLMPTLFIVALAASLVAQPALAWGARGHRIIGAVAQSHLTAAAQAAVTDLLEGEDLATASTWADEMRNTTVKREFWNLYAASWHYVNLPPGQDDYAASPKASMGDAVQALETFTAILADQEVPQGPVREGLESYFGDLDSDPRAVKAFALRFMIHLLGDLQQPLHAGYEEDLGGNRVTLNWFGERTNLHSLWDSGLIEYLDLSYTEHARRLEMRISRTPLSDIRHYESTDVLVWIGEDRQLLQRIYGAHERGEELGYDYAAMFTPTVELQLVKGGLRTANYLNALFGGWPIGTAP